MNDESASSRLGRAREFAERRLSPDELRAALSVPITRAERENAEQLIAWFIRRYSTPIERLAYVRQAYARWAATSDAITVPGQGVRRP
jgi:hypothetical protein